MTNITENYSPTNNFWEYNPQFLAAEPFCKLYKSDKTSQKVGSSAKMWAISLVYHPKSDFYYLTDKLDKIAAAIKRQYKIDINWNELNIYVETFIDTTTNQAQKSLIAWDQRMKERDEFLNNQKWSFDYINEDGKLVKGNADQLDKMHAQTYKHYKEYEIIVKELQDLEIKSQNSSKSNTKELGI